MFCVMLILVRKGLCQVVVTLLVGDSEVIIAMIIIMTLLLGYSGPML